ncbi:MAG: HNH endonuclease [Deltaproteobacteria bacterium]|nr:HNH endonuclease [Deltaproteobacteria bacterium]
MAVRTRKRNNRITYQVYWNDPETKRRCTKTFYNIKEANAFNKIALANLAAYRAKHKTMYTHSDIYRPKFPTKADDLEVLRARCADLYADNRVRVADIFDYVMETIGLPVRFKDVATTIANREKEKGRAIPAGIRVRILARDGYRCKMCGASAADTKLHVDHIIPVSRGGITEERNLQTLCQRCNLGKGALSLE